MLLQKKPALAAAVLALLALVLNITAAQAHERREVGPNQFVVGWDVEPAFEGEKNGVGLRITASDTTQPMEGAQETLQVEVTHVPLEVSQTYPLRTVFGEPGYYLVDIVPTAPGQYRFRFFGAVNGEEVNETFESGPNTFDDVASIDSVQFPQKLAPLGQVEGAARGAQAAATAAQTTAMDAEDNAGTAQILAIIGLAVGAVGLILGGSGLWMASRRK
jgi:hypothetical protein